jgi:hypothetical protein
MQQVLSFIPLHAPMVGGQSGTILRTSLHSVSSDYPPDQWDLKRICNKLNSILPDRLV